MKSFTEVASGAVLAFAGFSYCVSLGIIFLSLPVLLLLLVLKGSH
jgi:hypothetical protein